MNSKSSIRKYFEFAWFMWRRALAFVLDIAVGAVPAYFVVDAMHDYFHYSTFLIVLSFAAVVTYVNVFFCLLRPTRNLFLRLFGLQLSDNTGMAVTVKRQVLRLFIRNFLFPLIVFEFFLGSRQFLHDWATKSYVVRKGENPNEKFQSRRFGWISLNLICVIGYISVCLFGSWFGSCLRLWFLDITDLLYQRPASAKMQRLLLECSDPQKAVRHNLNQIDIDMRMSNAVSDCIYLEKKEPRSVEEDLELLLAGQLAVRFKNSQFSEGIPSTVTSESIIKEFSTFINLPEDRLEDLMKKQVSQPFLPWQNVKKSAIYLAAKELSNADLPDVDYCNEAFLKHLNTEGKKMTYLWCLRVMRDDYFADDMYRAKSGSFANEVRKLEEKWNYHSVKNSNS